MENKVILITGASSGLGKACADYLVQKGYTVYGTSRKTQNKSSSTVQMVQMDVNDDASVNKAISSILKKEGVIDVVINNAGWGISGSIEESTIEETKTLFETNFFGTLRVIQHVLPSMRKQHQGMIINVSSIGGVLGLPYQGMYSATKFAVEGMTEALRMEVSPFGIKVVLVEPGDFKTSFTGNRKKISPKSNSAYHDFQKNTEAVVEHDEQHGSDPIIIGSLVHRIIRSSHPKVRYRVGGLSQKFIASLKGVLSDRILQWILMKYYKVK